MMWDGGRDVGVGSALGEAQARPAFDGNTALARLPWEVRT
jgi:hypothetical protein